MSFPPIHLAPALQASFAAFAAAQNFVDLYMAYNWENDTYANGFPDILDLELQLSANDSNGGIQLADVQAVATWGRLRNPGRVAGPAVVLPQNTFWTANGLPQPGLAGVPQEPVANINATGVGPTYRSKVARFAAPQEYGAIDTRCVRVFGQGDPANQRHNWLQVSARNAGYGWYIDANQANWPNGYDLWINILRYFASNLPANCPHPVGFVNAGMRLPNQQWQCADVEMALFTYASQFV